MNETFITQQVEQYKKNISMQSHNKTLLRYTGLPVVKEERLFFTLLPLLNGEDWNESMYVSSIAVSLIFSSLAAHDLVKEDNATSKEQQLQVLAGDYYSGRYYQVLANAGEIELIQQLSTGVATISELKTRFYDDEEYTFDELIQSIQIIESKPIEQFFEYYGFHEYVFLMKEALLLAALKKEYNKFELNEPAFYINKSIIFQTNMTDFKVELDNMEQAFIHDVSSSKLLIAPIKMAILERMKIHSLQK
ncbi:heptaprenyl diphosphate synthase [Psychrobacillus insolitus]|uniref:Heptaprenyl diphosphate synthase n=1 Tax=Psychrobacillus insolitus TaxID=1461 RepID=A0A2W7NB61_9BACI|nr:heptaprenyl diphosphate synthase component 1 [Psychrobacillus insolitus]PZX07709.1 heptaprenyl diphosphate synthase [Psychrobacillus insolitus]